MNHVKAALLALAEEHGVLRPADVVEAARDPHSPLHKQFVWDDTEAARRFRLAQAAQLIRRVHVVLTTSDAKPVTVRAFVSLPSDRTAKAGYRSTVKVLDDAGRSQEMLGAALDDLRAIQAKYAALSQLAPVFAAIDAVLIEVAAE